MSRRSKGLSATLITGALLLTSLGLGGVAISAGAPAPHTAAAQSFAATHSGHAMAASTANSPRTRTATATSPPTRPSPA